MIDTYIIEIASVNPPPVSLAMCDTIDCPVCGIDLSDELNIDLYTFTVDENTTIECKDCVLQLKFKIVKI